MVLVDDHAAVRGQLTEVLRLHGFDVVGSAGTCQDGRTTVERLRPEVAVIDNQMPDGLGVDLCVDLSQTCPDTLSIICSASITSQQAAFAVSHGAAAVVSKDARARELIDTIDRLVAARTRTRARRGETSATSEPVGGPSLTGRPHRVHPLPRRSRACPEGPAW